MRTTATTDNTTSLVWIWNYGTGTGAVLVWPFWSSNYSNTIRFYTLPPKKRRTRQPRPTIVHEESRYWRALPAAPAWQASVRAFGGR